MTHPVPEEQAFQTRLQAMLDGAQDEETLRQALLQLGNEHLRLLRRSSKISHISDGYQKQLCDLNRELKTALAEVQTLRGFIPICAGCKKIRNDTGYWEEVECYISKHSQAVFSHGLCPDCRQIYFPEFPGIESKP